MSPLYLDEKLLLLGIGSSYIGIVIFYLLIKNNLPNIYQSEKAFFSQFSTVSLKPNSPLDYIAYLILFSVFALMIWHNFFPSGFTHFDSLLYIGDITCNFERIQFQTYVAKRFFPFGHQEWSVLSPILTLSNCAPYIPFILVTAQYFAVAYLLFCIIPFENLALRLIALALMMSNTSFFILFSSVIIPDRNSLFLMIAFLYCLIYFFKTDKPIYLLCAFLCANTALYFKEPIFVYLVSFAFTSFCFHLYQKQFRLLDIFTPLTLIRKQPIEILLPILCLCFVSIWAIFVFIFHPSTVTYGANDSNYIAYIIIQLQNYPLFALIIVMVIGYIIDYKNIQKHQFSLMLFIGGLFYALVIIFLKFYNLRYFCIAEFSILLAACYYLKNITWQKNFKYIGFAFLIASFAVFSAIKKPQNLFANIQHAKITQHQIIQTKHNLPLNDSDANKIFYYHINGKNIDYSVSVFKSITLQIEPMPDIEFYSFLDFQPENIHAKTAFQTDKWNPDDYDITILRRQNIDDITWQSLQAKYGNKIQKITNFPAWMGDTEGYNIYILQN